FIGLYIVRSQWRGRGYGMQLWEAALQQLTARMDGDRPCIGLDGVLDREADYGQAGFKAAYHHARHVYEPAASDGIPEAVIPLADVPLAAIAGYEVRLFPASRELFLDPWIRLAGAAYGVMEQGRLVGYGVLRPCRQGFKIGPLFADSIEIADRLFLALTHRCVGQFVFIDIPTINPSFSKFVARYGLQPVFTCVRMYRGHEPRLDVERIFGITTLELG
ncbi:MAG: GNAT family N-acetyltransferase, partial [Thermosynechococcaceae cyanobacterium]